MKYPTACVLTATVLLAGCQTLSGWSTEDALRAETIEMQLDEAGRIVELEYHVDPGRVPPVVRAAMDQLHPGGRVVAAEEEHADGERYWELSKEIDGREVEAMFLSDGTLYSEEIEVPEAGIPASVKDCVRASRAGSVTKWEEIRDGERQLVEYHAKVTDGARKYKVVVTTEGVLLRVVREVPAELEIPLL